MRIVSLGTVLLLIGVAIAAQEMPPPPAREGASPSERPLPQEWIDRDAREVMEAVMMTRFSRELELNDEQTVLMMRRIEEFKDEISQARQHRGELVKALEAAVKSGASEADIAAKMNELVVHDRTLAEARFNMVDRAGEGLSMAQRAKLYLLMGDFEADMRKLIQKARMRAAGKTPRRPNEDGPQFDGPPEPDPNRPPMNPDAQRLRPFEHRRPAQGPRRNNSPAPEEAPNAPEPPPPQP